MTNRGAVWRRVMGGVALAGLMRASAVQAENWYWVGGSGDWNTPANWGFAADGPGGVGVPVSGNVYLRNSEPTDLEVALSSGTGLSPQLDQVFIDGVGGGAATLRIDAALAELKAYSVNLGLNGVGHVVQGGGGVSVQKVHLSSWDTGIATYALSGGRLDADSVELNGTEAARSKMTQSGGTISARSVFLWGAGAAYQLSAGALTAHDLTVGGAFTQTGGSVTVRQLFNGDYRWVGGDLTVENYWGLDGAMSFPDSPVTLTVNGRVDFGHPELTRGGNLSLLIGAGSIVNRPADFDPATAFGTYENAGIDHIVGTTLTIPAGRQVRTVGVYDDPVTVFGSIAPADDEGSELNLAGALTLHPGGSVEAAGVSVDGFTTTIRGGTLRAGRLWAVHTFRLVLPSGTPPPPSPGRIVQEGGTVRAALLQVGEVGAAEYHLSGGELFTDAAAIGPSGIPHRLEPATGLFRQTGGTHRSERLRVGEGGPSEGDYVLSGGSLVARELEIGAKSPDGGFGGGQQWGVGRFHFDDAGAELTVTSEMLIGPKGGFTAVPGAVLHLRGASLSILTTDAQRVTGFDVLRVVFEGPEASAGAVAAAVVESGLEVAGEDRGASLEGFVGNFVIDRLEVGGEGAAWVRLMDEADNQLGSAVGDAIYVRHLIVNEGSTLDLGGRKLYVLDFENDGGTIQANGGELTVVPEPDVLGLGGLTLLVGRCGRRTRRRGMPH